MQILEKFTQMTFGSKQLHAVLGLYPDLAHARTKTGYLKPIVALPGSGHPMIVEGAEFLRLALAEHLYKDKKFSIQVAQDISMLFDSIDWRDIISLGREFFVVELDRSRPLVRSQKYSSDSGSGGWLELDVEDLSAATGKELLVIEARKLCEEIEKRLQALGKGK